ncbi:MAG: hypothetical protein RO009_17085 [Pseudorhodoplanes sp.]|nr:hypothetical protein [Pseudorhodoplanes sp.]
MQGVATEIEMIPQQVHPKWKLMLVLYAMIAGAVANVYMLITAIQFFANN